MYMQYQTNTEFGKSIAVSSGHSFYPSHFSQMSHMPGLQN